jgi:UDP-glucose:(heptosyl)LPS alpha-1,3-glucosyltransferase
MKIALTDSHLDPARGGAQTYIRNFARRLVRDGHEVHVYAASPDAREKGILWHQVPVPPFSPLRDYACALRTRDLLLKERFDVIQGFGSSVQMDVYRPGGGVRRALLEHEASAMDNPARRCWMQIRRATSLRHRLLLRLEKLQFQPGGAHDIIAVSNRVRDEIVQFYHCEPERITVIHNGADLARFTPEVRERFRKAARQELGLPNDEIMILLVGNNFKLKGVPLLIRALPALRRISASFRLVVVGRGRRAPCERLARKLGVGDLVHFAGSTPQPEKYYAAADIFCLPSYYDPCANALLEALACGLPAVTSTSNGSGEILTPGREGYAVPFGDVPQLARRIGEFFNRERREAASLAARALAEAHSAERNFEEVMKVYAKVVERKRAIKQG